MELYLYRMYVCVIHATETSRENTVIHKYLLNNNVINQYKYTTSLIKYFFCQLPHNFHFIRLLLFSLIQFPFYFFLFFNINFYK